ncbi:hypothetical protein BGZ76_006684 [Entomortierella beljakovae]|nr:hypothetical protein BGZ76_006684 [Entomortierella beljakovae]
MASQTNFLFDAFDSEESRHAINIRNEMKILLSLSHTYKPITSYLTGYKGRNNSVVLAEEVDDENVDPVPISNDTMVTLSTNKGKERAEEEKNEIEDADESEWEDISAFPNTDGDSYGRGEGSSNWQERWKSHQSPNSEISGITTVDSIITNANSAMSSENHVGPTGGSLLERIRLKDSRTQGRLQEFALNRLHEQRQAQHQSLDSRLSLLEQSLVRQNDLFDRIAGITERQNAQLESLTRERNSDVPSNLVASSIDQSEVENAITGVLHFASNKTAGMLHVVEGFIDSTKSAITTGKRSRHESEEEEEEEEAPKKRSRKQTDIFNKEILLIAA